MGGDGAQLGLTLGHAAGNAAEAAQDRRMPGWSEQAHALLVRFVRFRPLGRDTFLSEEFRKWATQPHIGLPDPTEPRAYGPLFTRAKNEGLIAPTGRYVISPDPVGHGRPAREWRIV